MFINQKRRSQQFFSMRSNFFCREFQPPIIVVIIFRDRKIKDIAIIKTYQNYKEYKNIYFKSLEIYDRDEFFW